jgi:hypothetical protein
MDSLGGVLEMNALPKDQIIEFIFSNAKDNIMPQDGLFYKLGILGFVITVVLLVIALLFALRYILKKNKFPKVT